MFILLTFLLHGANPVAEHPLLMELQSKGANNGINFRDDEDNFIQWINDHGNPFFISYVMMDLLLMKWD